MQPRLHRNVDLTPTETAALGRLSEAVFPPEEAANWPGRAIEWAPPQWCVVTWDETGEARSTVGIVLREGLSADQPVHIGGICGVKTHPDARRQGLVARGLQRAFEFFFEQRVDFALLVCESRLVPFYERLGWRLHPGPLLVTQRGESVEFTFNRPMTHAVCLASSPDRPIDLAGPPW